MCKVIDDKIMINNISNDNFIQTKLLNTMFNNKINHVFVIHKNKSILTFIEKILDQLLFSLNTTTNNIFCTKNINSSYHFISNNESITNYNEEEKWKKSIISLINIDNIKRKFIFLSSVTDIAEYLINKKNNIIADCIIIQDTLSILEFQNSFSLLKWYKQNINKNLVECYVTNKTYQQFCIQRSTTLTSIEDLESPVKIFFETNIDPYMTSYINTNIFNNLFSKQLHEILFDYYNLSSNQIFLFDKTGSIIYSTGIEKNTSNKNINQYLLALDLNISAINTIFENNKLTNKTNHFIDDSIYLELLENDMYILFFRYNLKNYLDIKDDGYSLYHSLYENLINILNAANDLIWSKDINGNYLYANEAICNKLLIASSPAEVIGKNDLYFAHRERLKHPENKQWHTFGELCQNSDEVVITNNKAQRFLEYGNIQGKYLYLDVFKTPLYNEQSKIIGTVGVGRDITSEETNKNVMKTIINNIDDLIIHFDNTSYTILFTNDNITKPKYYLNTYNIKVEEIYKYSIYDLFTAPYHKQIVQLINKAIRTGISTSDIINLNINQNQNDNINLNDYTYLVSVKTILNNSNFIDSYVLNMKHITSSELLSLQLEQSDKILSDLINDSETPIIIYRENKIITNKIFKALFNNDVDVISSIKDLEVNQTFKHNDQSYKITNIKSIYSGSNSQNNYLLRLASNVNTKQYCTKIIYIDDITKVIQLESVLMQKLNTLSLQNNSLNSSIQNYFNSASI